MEFFRAKGSLLGLLFMLSLVYFLFGRTAIQYLSSIELIPGLLITAQLSLICFFWVTAGLITLCTRRLAIYSRFLFSFTVLLLVAWLSITSVNYLSIGISVMESRGSYMANLLLSPLLLFFVGIQFVGRWQMLVQQARVFWVSFFLWGCVVVFGVYLGSQGFSKPFLQWVIFRESGIFQSMSDATAVAGIVGISLSVKKSTHFFLSGGVLLLLYWLGSRPPLACFFMISVFVFYWKFFFRSLRSALFGVMVMFFSVVSIVLASDFLGEFSFDDRISVFLGGMENDSSWNHREKLLNENIEIVDREVIALGNFSPEVKGDVSGYVHNAFSILVSYGIGVFAFYSALWFCGLFVLIKMSHGGFKVLAISMWLFCTLMMIGARAYIWPYPWLVFGFFAGVSIDNRWRAFLPRGGATLQHHDTVMLAKMATLKAKTYHY